MSTSSVATCDNGSESIKLRPKIKIPDFMRIYLLCLAMILPTFLFGQVGKKSSASGNPVFQGWYADPEGIIFQRHYWIYPTYSAPFDEQVFFDAFSSPDLVHWTKHERILDTA